MSTRSKGRLAENQMIKILINWGYKPEAIEQARPTLKMIGKGRFISSQNDFFGLFDILAKDKSRNTTTYIQVKHTKSGTITEVRPKIRRFKGLYGCGTDIFIVAEKVPYKGFKLHYILEKEYKIVNIDLNGNFQENGKTN